VQGESVVLRCCPKAVRVEGPLAVYAAGFGAHLVGQRCMPSSRSSTGDEPRKFIAPV
jgi:hypothetical protein